MLYLRWEGPYAPTFLPPSKPEQATCIEHLAKWDPQDLTLQIGPTLTIDTSFLDHNRVLGRASLPLLIPPVTPILRTTRTPRVPTSKYPIPPHTLAAWKTHVAVAFHTPSSLAPATVKAILTSLESAPHPPPPEDPTGPRLGDRDSILYLAADLQTIL